MTGCSGHLFSIPSIGKGRVFRFPQFGKSSRVLGWPLPQLRWLTWSAFYRRALWSAYGIAQYQFQWSRRRLLGGHVRVGLDDNLCLAKGISAPSSAALGVRAVKIIELLGEHVASRPKRATISGLTTNDAVARKSQANN